MEWSDGEPFTADDVIFTFENFLLNRFAEGNSIARFTLGGELVQFSKVDDRTIRAELPTSYGAFYMVLTAALIYPEHILADKIDPNDPGSVNNVWTTDTDPAEIVATGPYMLQDYVVDQKVTLAANPRSWKMDPGGNVLPYVDTLEYLILPNRETHAAQLIGGEIDYIAGMTTKVSPADYPFLKQAELDGENIVVYAASPTNPTPSPLHIGFNFDVDDPELAELFNSHEFRVAMEHALDRERVIEEVYNSLAVLGGTPVLPHQHGVLQPGDRGDSSALRSRSCRRDPGRSGPGGPQQRRMAGLSLGQHGGVRPDDGKHARPAGCGVPLHREPQGSGREGGTADPRR